MRHHQLFALLFWLVVSISSTEAFEVKDEPPAENNASLRPRLRDLGISIGVLPTGPMNSLTDVTGVTVGHRTRLEGDSIRTGVTVVKPTTDNVFLRKIPAAVYVANGFGKFVGTTQIEELGVIETPIVITNTLSTFAAADALVGWALEQPGCENVRSVNPVVAECNDGYLNAIRRRSISAEDVKIALQNAQSGPVEEGCVGSGTGMRCLGWKGGIGTSSRKLPKSLGGYTLGVLVQTNFGGSLTVAGVPVGRELGRYYLKDEVRQHEDGSCIVIVATDAPLDSRRLKRLAKRAPLGLAAVGSPISHGSGDYVLSFSTAEQLRTGYSSENTQEQVELLRDDQLSPLFQAVRDATEEAVINSMLKAVTTTGHMDRTVDAIDPAEVLEICRQHSLIKSRTDQKVSQKGSTFIRSSTRAYNASITDGFQNRIDHLERSLPALMQQHAVPGVSMAVIQRRQLVWSRGFGLRCADSMEGVDPDSIMEACSMSKPFFAYVVLKLVEQKLFDLDQPLVEYLGEDYLENDPRHREITARMVLSHTTGLPNWREGGWQSGNPLSLKFKPGTDFRYSGEGFLMLQRAVEKCLSTDLEVLVQKQLIQPLKLTNTGFLWNEKFARNAACGHDKEGHVKQDRNYFSKPNAAYTLYTSAEDYAKFLVEVMKKDRSQEHSISAASLNSMFEHVSYRQDQDAHWGLGWGLTTVDGVRQVYHHGANGTGFRCHSEFLPEPGEGLVIMTNSLNGKALWKAMVEIWHQLDEMPTR